MEESSELHRSSGSNGLSFSKAKPGSWTSGKTNYTFFLLSLKSEEGFRTTLKKEKKNRERRDQDEGIRNQEFIIIISSVSVSSLQKTTSLPALGG